MSREIDPKDIESGNLSEEEVAYLAQRDRLPDDYDQNQARKLLQPQGRSLEDTPHTGDVNAKTSPVTSAEEARGGAQELPSDGFSDEGEEDVSYREMTNDQLRAELARRGLSIDGNKAALVSRLEEDDAEEEEE